MTVSVGAATGGRPRVLLVSDDDTFSSELKPRLPGMDVLSLTESSVWLASRAGLDVTRGINVVLVDNHVSGRLQMGLYETLRPSEGVAHVPVIFTRSKLTAASAGFSHELDVYQPEDANVAQTATLVADVLTAGPKAAERAEQAAAAERATLAEQVALAEEAARAERDATVAALPVRRQGKPVRRPGRPVARPSSGGPAAVAARTRPAVAGTGPGLLQRLALWGIASALIGFTFWPLFGTGPVREAVFGPLRALAGGNDEIANAGHRTASTP